MGKTVNIHDAKTHLSALIKEVLEGGKVTIAKNNKPVVELVKIKEKPVNRSLGSLKNKLVVHGSFDEADKAIEEMFYNSVTMPDEKISD